MINNLLRLPYHIQDDIAFYVWLNAIKEVHISLDEYHDEKSRLLLNDDKLRIYAMNYNILRIMSGVGGSWPFPYS